MREVWTMWRNTRMVVLVAQIAALYAAVLIPFKVVAIIPGITEVRPANAIPVVCSLLFGPAAAWGAAFGNLIADFFGTLGPGSLFGFVANFLYGYLPYRLWKAMTREEPELKTHGPLWRYAALVLLSSLATAIVAYWTVGMFPHARQALNWTACLVLVQNGLLTLLLWPRMDEEASDKSPLRMFQPACLLGVVGGAMVAVISPASAKSPVGLTAWTQGVVVLNSLLTLLPVWMGATAQGGDRGTHAQVLRFVLVSALASAVCAFYVGWGVQTVGLAPYGIVAPLVFLNNFVMACLLGPLLLATLYPRIRRWGLRYDDVASADEQVPLRWAGVGAGIAALVSVVGLLAGMWAAASPETVVSMFAAAGVSVPAASSLQAVATPMAVLILVVVCYLL